MSSEADITQSQSRQRARAAVALVSGVLFGVGLCVSRMIDPAKVLAFLDVTGNWDPTLAFVLLGALAVTVPVFPLVLRRESPLLASGFSLPTKREIDARLLGGAVLFGVGWGLAGLCPGPAIAALVTGHLSILVFGSTCWNGVQWLDKG